MESTFRGVFLTCTDAEATAAFYREIADLPLTTEGDEEYTYFVVEAGGVVEAVRKGVNESIKVSTLSYNHPTHWLQKAEPDTWFHMECQGDALVERLDEVEAVYPGGTLHLEIDAGGLSYRILPGADSSETEPLIEVRAPGHWDDGAWHDVVVTSARGAAGWPCRQRTVQCWCGGTWPRCSSGSRPRVNSGRRKGARAAISSRQSATSRQSSPGPACQPGRRSAQQGTPASRAARTAFRLIRAA